MAAICALAAAATGPAAAASARASAPYVVCLQPLGAHDAGLLGPIGRGFEQAYGFRVRQLGQRPLPASAWYPPRGRYRAARLLEHLDASMRARVGCDAVLAITAVDVSITKGEHVDWGVMGLAKLRGGVAVVSSYRLRRGADRPLVVRRAVKVSIHELGHVLGLPHGNEGPGCIMNDAGGAVRTIDRALGPLCAGERAAAEAFLGRTLPRRDSLDWNAILRAPR